VKKRLAHAKDSRWWSLSPADFVAQTGIGDAGLADDCSIPNPLSSSARLQSRENPAEAFEAGFQILDHLRGEVVRLR